MVEHVPEDSFLHSLDVFGVRDGRRVWRSGTCRNTRYYPWDSLHGEVEVFNSRGRHLGAVDAITGKQTKDLGLGRRLRI
ncbi:MAG: colicin E3/pyocin S6 family cytotoxin [Dehalococcoidia bacterium]